jgi:parallel beta-helix repeat protein
MPKEKKILTVPSDHLEISRDTILKPGVYWLPKGITITADSVTLDGNGAVLVGSNRSGCGVTILSRQDVTIKNLHIQEYGHGIFARGCRNLSISDCRVTATAEVPANTLFLNVWLPLEQAYGGGILLAESQDCSLTRNDLQHQMNGVLSYNCQRLRVTHNNASYCSGWGFHLFETCDSLYEDNLADYCCRWEPRGPRRGHMGADAAGFLIIHSSSRNIFRRNLARLGGDGFFLAGLSPAYQPVPCNDNLFEENDGSWSPNIAFEATFSAGNIYRNNFANHCNYGFWLGFSSHGLLEENQMIGNHQAGIAVENGVDFQVRRNLFQDNQHGILLWSKHIPEFLPAVPENETSYNWSIERNEFIRNNKAIRIAANQDHGLRPYRVPEGQSISGWFRPHDHLIRSNRFQDNQIGIETLHTDQTRSEINSFKGSLLADQMDQNEVEEA